MAEINLSTIAASTGGFVINGQCPGDQSGYSVASAGDVNGDGLTDLIVGAPNGDPAAGELAGRSYVVFGQTGTTAIDLSAVADGTGGFVINGQGGSDRSGYSIAGAGDVNGDGLADLIVGAPESAPAAGADAGRSYVVFGKTTASAVDLSAVVDGFGGFVINGACEADYSGFSVAGAGDVNGDGLADLIVGSSEYSPRHYVVFGKSGGGPLDLSLVANGIGGFALLEYDGDRSSVAGAGDVNGDGLADLIVGLPRAYGYDGADAGRSYVVFGKTGGATVSLGTIAQGYGGGFTIWGHEAEYSGISVAGAGDVNGDGLADLIVGANRSDPAGSDSAGRSYVVFGKTGFTSIHLSAVAGGTGGFVINGQCPGDQSGYSVASAGDVNGDGLTDLIVGARYADPTAETSGAGRSYVVFGKSTGSEVNLSAVAGGTGGFVINGECGNDYSGYSVAGAGDVNGDGLADLIVGATHNDPAAGGDAGRSYVIFGSTTGAFGQTAVDQLGGGGDDTLTGTGSAETLVGGAGNDILTGNGGADVLYGGTGDDRFILNASNAASLSAGFGVGANSTQLSRIDGGGGLDTLALTGGGITLDLSAIAHQGGSTPASTSRLESIERIDLTGSGDNTVSVGHEDLLDLAGMNLINSGTQGALGWENGTYSFAESEQRHQLIVDGNAGDALLLASGFLWANMGTVLNGGDTYTVYNSDTGRAQLLVANAIEQGLGGFVINGQGECEAAGLNVAGAGDVNGDGLADVIVESKYEEDAGRNSYVVFGKSGSDPIDLSAVAAGSGGFVFNGLCTFEYDLNGSVAGAGDVNGDGLDDLVVGTRYNEDETRTYVVFGRTAPGAIDLSAIEAGTGGFAINPLFDEDGSGVSASGAGDVNGDGLADLIVGAPGIGGSFVVFGRTAGPVDLSAVAEGTGGFVIAGEDSDEDYAGFSVAGAGDVNGDCLADLVVGAMKYDRFAAEEAGRTYVVFGRSTGTFVDLSTVAAGTGGFVVNGRCEDEWSGRTVAGVGDVNGDGLADILVGTKYDESPSRSYVVFGKSAGDSVDLSAVAAGDGGFLVNGHCTFDYGPGASSTVTGAGDVNGDGLADILVGTKYGASYVVFGKTGGGAVDLSAIATGEGGFLITGQGEEESSGFSVAGAGDVNGDGLADLLVGAPGNNAPGIPMAGQTYVIFGSTSGAFHDTAVDRLGTAGNDTLNGTTAGGRARAETLVGGAGNDTLVGRGGADVLYGGAGNDTLVVNASNVRALNESFGAGGNADRLSRVDGGSGVDTLELSGSGIELDLSLIANQGAGTTGSTSRLESIERINLTGSGGNTLTLAAADVLDLSDTGNTLRVDGNAGDAVIFLNAGSAAVSLAAGYHQFVQGGATLRVNTQVAITLIGNEALDDTLTGTGSADSIFGLGAGDELLGNGGNDTLDGGAGNDVLNGGSGSDRASYSEAAIGVAVNLATAVAQDTGGAGFDTLTSIENLTGSDFDDTLGGTGSTNRLSGGAGNDALDGEGGNDTLDGGTGNDTLGGGSGNDTLDGGAGRDRMTGGAGNDTYRVDLSQDAVTESAGAGSGTDLVQSSASYSLAGRANVENLTLTGAGNLNGTGNAENNVITGNSGRNTLNGGAANDTLNGGTGNDTLIGGSGADTMTGSSGNDTLKGLAAADVLTGGSGADRFDFDAVGDTGTSAATRDRITDFNRAQGDKIDLSTIDANPSAGGNQAFQFIGGGPFSGNSAGKLRYDAAADVLFGSTDADTAAEFSIQLPNLSNMVAGDFIL